MARLPVNPTRMELTKLKKRLKTAKRGHRLLKDKRDELMRQFIDLIKENKELRDNIENDLENAQKEFMMASALMSSQNLEEALMFPKKSISLDVEIENNMSVRTPKFIIDSSRDEKAETIFPYGFNNTSAKLDDSILTYSDVADELLKLAEIEKKVALIADEIEKTRRRVNALEYVLIPNLEETIKYITMKLEENERGNLTRLMKVKDMMVQEALEKKRKNQR